MEKISNLVAKQGLYALSQGDKPSYEELLAMVDVGYLDMTAAGEAALRFYRQEMLRNGNSRKARRA